MSSPKSLTGKVAVVTGGSKGIGRAISLRLASLGASVVVNYSSDSSAADEVVSQIGSEQAISIKADGSSIPEIESLVQKTVAKFRKIDILIPCAGIMKNAVLDGVTEADYEKTMALNVKGPLFLAQKAVPHFPSEGGKIILFSTNLANASTLTPNYLTYLMSKGAIEQMTRSLSKELCPKGIMVNCVAPGPTSTDLFLKGKSEELLKTIASWIPMKRIGKPEEVAEVVAFLAGPGSNYVTGQLIKVNGGLS